jgi:hypothetical protein
MAIAAAARKVVGRSALDIMKCEARGQKRWEFAEDPVNYATDIKMSARQKDTQDIGFFKRSDF